MNQVILSIIRRQYEEGVDKERKFGHIKKFFDMTKKGEYTLDDETWSDMDLDRVYSNIDRTYSTPGEAELYSMLRNPLKDEQKLKERHEKIEKIQQNQGLREKLSGIFYQLGRDRKNTFLDMMESELKVSRIKYYLYTFIGKIIPLISILLIIFGGEKYIPCILISSAINMLINYKEREKIKSKGIIYLGDILRAAKKICNIKDDIISDDVTYIKKNLKNIQHIDRSTRLIYLINMWQGFFEVFATIFLIEETAYYRVSGLLKDNKVYLMNIFSAIGKLDAIISVAGYEKSLPYTIKPNFIDEVCLDIEEGIHPLLHNPVANSICIKDKGIVLTGTNMSGKSTFLRMLGINIIFAQTFYFALAKKYEAPFLNVVTSISPNDDISKGKSYYMAEAEGILRIIKALDKELPVFCPIDEIFRGTNPVERISMSAEILSYINSKRTISIVATHDRELADILMDSYEFYYFSENIDDKDGLSFDYKIKEGVSQTRNAIRLLEYIGYPKDITEKSYKRAETIKGFI